MSASFTTTVTSDLVVTVHVSGEVTVWRRMDDPVMFDAWVAATQALGVMFDPSKNAAFYPEDSGAPVDEDASNPEFGDFADDDFPLDYALDSLALDRAVKVGASQVGIEPASSGDDSDTMEDTRVSAAQSYADDFAEGFSEGYNEVIRELTADPSMNIGSPLEGVLTATDLGFERGWEKGFRDFKGSAALEELDRLSRVAAAHALAETQALEAISPLYGHTTPMETRDDPQWHVNLSPEDIERYVLKAAQAPEVAIPKATLRPRRT